MGFIDVAPVTGSYMAVHSVAEPRYKAPPVGVTGIYQRLIPGYVQTGLRREAITHYSLERLAGPITEPGQEQAEPQGREQQIAPYLLSQRAKKAEPCKKNNATEMPVLLSRLLISFISLALHCEEPRTPCRRSTGRKQ